MASKEKVGVDLGLTDKDKEQLHHIALTTIENKTRGKRISISPPSSDKLTEKRGAFVSLYKKGMLRGCIGSLEPASPLYKTVEEMSLSAAFRDPRFRAVSAEELPFLEIEISVLTPFEKIKKPDEIQVGLHGIMVRQGARSGLLLPQVATERNWDRMTFLEETCRKAGLPKNAWKEEDTTIYVFSADVF